MEGKRRGRAPTVWQCQFYPHHKMSGKNGYCFDCNAYTGWKVEKKEVE